MTAQIIRFDIAKATRIINTDREFDKRRNVMLHNAQILADAGREDAAKATIHEFDKHNGAAYR